MNYHPTRHRPFLRIGLGILLLVKPLLGDTDEISDLSLEELGDFPVVQSAKGKKRLFDAPAGAFVFDEKAIENLPVDSIPEMLRYAPGVHIMRSSNGNWGLGIRGMNSRFLSRALLTVDDQSLYGTLFAGLFGSDHDLLIDDVASVEVVYGPGGSLWGPNSANGRVNVIKKSAFETEGSVLRARVGTQNRSVEGRHGWSINEKTAARVYARYNDRQSNENPVFDDDWETKRAGFQYDTRPSSSDLVSISAEIFESELGSARTILLPETGAISTLDQNELHDGLNAQAKWTRQFDSENGFNIRAWIGSTNFESSWSNYEIGIVGIEGRARFRLSDRQKIVFTTGITVDEEELIDSEFITFQADYNHNNTTAHAGGEYTHTLIPDRLDLSIGMSGNYDTYSGEIAPLPSARMLFKPNESERFWLSYSRSTRSVPSGLNDVEYMYNGYTPIPPTPIPTPFGTFIVENQLVVTTRTPQIENENLDTFEAGYRKQFSNKGSFVLSGFYNKYDNLLGAQDFGVTPVLTVPNPYLLTPIVVSNIAKGESYGLEASLKWDLNESQNFTLNYSAISDSFSNKLPPGTPPEYYPVIASEVDTLSNNVPNQMASLWYSTRFSRNWSADLGLRYTEGFNSIRTNQADIFQSDVRLSWSSSERLKISLVGRNLLNPTTDETSLKDSFGQSTELKREAYIELSYKL
ncbi:TonB-dependent receptor domain protein [Verrucomicrobiia bacterium DG1235]|nr:TonB-dependent receptor domain protein [Verrucomicrobiae bacterium DG1235]